MPKAIRPRVEKLEHAERFGDWHDKPLRWRVVTGTELQKFATKEDARLYARARRMSVDERSAGNLWMHWINNRYRETGR